MHAKPMSESDGEFEGQFRKAGGSKCRKCGAEAVYCRLWVSADGAYEDVKYQCRACGHAWWVDGPDA